MEKIRLGDIEGIRHDGINYIPQVACREDLQTLYDALARVEDFAELGHETKAAIEAIQEKWGLGD